MCREPNMYGKRQRQKGFLMPLALFIVVGLGALALAINRLSGSSSTASIHEAVSVQALYAAESATQYAMHRLLFDATTTTQVNERCAAVTGQVLQFDVTGLSNCSATLSCGVEPAPASAPVYTVLSRGICGSGGMQTQRTVRAAVVYD